MPRWESNTRERLEAAALALFTERGFEAATVADIAERAGLTERTFFRYFTDKREVLFAGQEALRDRMLAAVTETPAGTPPLAIVEQALLAMTPIFDARREVVHARQRVVHANAELRERELHKMAMLATLLAEALVTRGVPPTTATLAAETGMTVFRLAFMRWIETGATTSYAESLRALFATLTDVVTATGA